MHTEHRSKPGAGVRLFTAEVPAYKAGTKMCSDPGRPAIFQLGTLLSSGTGKPACLLNGAERTWTDGHQPVAMKFGQDRIGFLFMPPQCDMISHRTPPRPVSDKQGA